ncbi:glycosyltransferase [Thiocapsa rosea]|uniref:Glycosyltransferase involved in cell wall biosynthesis n=1 Tax=Thiocapsa rosea TaxID=69360 RepID=A0A495V6W1_9GAMM|nr:glycosyltransferase [Thiocapsa rosea]RKT44440.1 glycosyltransferase involved in cell wall biosynthesis [Thiocapsa rosea]
MRVLHVGKFHPPFAGGMENFIADLLPALEAQGVCSAVLVHDEGRAGGHSPDASRIYRARSYGRVLYAPVSPSFPFRLHRAIRDFRPDLLHLHLPNTSAFWAMSVPSARALPWVVHWHADVVTRGGDPRLDRAYRLYRPFEQALLARSHLIIATSPPYLEASRALAPWQARCRVIPLGLDAGRLADPDPAMREDADRRWGKGVFRVLAVGRLARYKGFDRLIEAAAALPGCRILIVGAGDQEPRLSARLQELGLGARVELMGFRSDAEMHGLLATCDVLCLPSLERAEAFGLVLLEAMRFAKPVVASDIPGSGVGWVVREAGHGLTTAPGDAERLAAALRALQLDPGRRRQLGDAGAAALRIRFGIASTARAIAELYRLPELEAASPAEIGGR